MSIPLNGLQQIHSHDPEEEIWNYYIARFTNAYYVKNFLQGKGIKSSSSAVTIANNAKQAIDFYLAYKNISTISKPILLLYSFEKLANMLILSTSSAKTRIGYHGVSYKNRKIAINKNGLFPKFHDCYSIDPTIYNNKLCFKLEDLIKNNPIRGNDLNGLLLRESNDLLLIKTSDCQSHEVIIHELDREFLFTFALSSLSRYKVNEWNYFIVGSKTDLIIDIQRYMKSIEVFFPTLVLSFMYRLRFDIVSFRPATITHLDGSDPDHTW